MPCVFIRNGAIVISAHLQQERVIERVNQLISMLENYFRYVTSFMLLWGHTVYWRVKVRSKLRTNWRLQNNEDLNLVDATRGTSLLSLITSSVEATHTALIDGGTMMIGYSSGKDSETVLHLFLMALTRAVRSGATISQHHFILHTDTVGLDKSMDTLLATAPERHGYMSGLNRIQRYQAKRRYAWEDCHPVGRTIYEGGYIKIRPDVYSPVLLER